MKMTNLILLGLNTENYKQKYLNYEMDPEGPICPYYYVDTREAERFHFYVQNTETNDIFDILLYEKFDIEQNECDDHFHPGAKNIYFKCRKIDILPEYEYIPNLYTEFVADFEKILESELKNFIKYSFYMFKVDLDKFQNSRFSKTKSAQILK